MENVHIHPVHLLSRNTIYIVKGVQNVKFKTVAVYVDDQSHREIISKESENTGDNYTGKK